MATLHLWVETTGLILAPEQHTKSALGCAENAVLFSETFYLMGLISWLNELSVKAGVTRLITCTPLCVGARKIFTSPITYLKFDSPKWKEPSTSVFKILKYQIITISVTNWIKTSMNRKYESVSVSLVISFFCISMKQMIMIKQGRKDVF